MPLPDLIAALEREGAERVASIRAQAEADAAAILAAAQTRAAQQEQQALQADDAALERQAQRELAQARRAARARWLQARSELLSRVYTQLLAALADALHSPDYPAQLAAQLEAAWPFLDGPVVIHCTPAIETVVRTLLQDRPHTTVLSDDATGHGVCLRSADGAVEIGCTLEDALAGQWPLLAIEVMRTVGDGS